MPLFAQPLVITNLNDFEDTKRYFEERPPLTSHVRTFLKISDFEIHFIVQFENLRRV